MTIFFAFEMGVCVLRLIIKKIKSTTVDIINVGLKINAGSIHIIEMQSFEFGLFNTLAHKCICND